MTGEACTRSSGSTVTAADAQIFLGVVLSKALDSQFLLQQESHHTSRKPEGYSASPGSEKGL